jgi:hypothetical protein
MAATVGVEADMAAKINLVSRAVLPHLLFMVLRDRAHHPPIGLGSPDQGAVKGTVGLWANQWRSN